MLIEAVLQLGDAVEEFINQLVGLLQSGGHSAECMVFCSWGAYQEQDQASRKSGIKRRSSHFPVSILFR